LGLISRSSVAIIFYSYPPIQLRGLAKEDPQLNWLEKQIGFSQANN